MIAQNIKKILSTLPNNVQLVAVSKTKPVSDILVAYQSGQRIFGENKVQEMVSKQEQLPSDIKWHMIGHLQTNKIKYIAPFVTLIHSVDSLKLLQTINREAEKHNRVIPCLLQIYIAREESKYGLDNEELSLILTDDVIKPLKNISINGFMGMATFTNNTDTVRNEFRYLKNLYLNYKNTFFKNRPEFNILSMGMSGDYTIAIEEGSTMVRIGSDIFGSRNQSQQTGL